MKIKELETIYKIFDAQDNLGGYEEWYGTQDDIIEYLEDANDEGNIPNYNKDDGWIKNLERYGLTFKIIN